MSPRHVSGQELDPAGPHPILQDVVDVDRRGRVRLSTRITSSIGWFSPAGGAIQTLMRFDRQGRIALLAWNPSGELVLARRNELVEEAENGDEGAVNDLLDLEARYHRRAIPKDSRLSLGSEGLLHLGIAEEVLHLALTETAPPRVYVAGVFDRIFIMSATYQAERIRAAAAIFPDLP